ncbi:hypothetical protein [Albidovulum inexpectatum]|nr:hypothetical protein [Albidovulum inexpectatum]
MTWSGNARATVRRRKVFYVPGYDPFPPRRYRELYRREAAEQARLSGFSIDLRAGQGGRESWQVHACIDEQDVESDFEVLVWSDIVQASMSRGILATYWQLVRTAWIYVRSGALWRLMRLRKGPMIAALYPIGLLLLQLVLAVLAGWAVGRGVAAMTGIPLLGWAVAVCVAWGVLAGFRAIDRRLYAYYLMHDYAFTARDGGAYPPEMEARIASFAERIAKALSADWDEVLVVGHSSGAHVAISVVADLVRSGHVAKGRGPALALLTLGQVVPMVSFLPRAKRLRADLVCLSTCEEIAWVDISAPGDGCAFALCDPVAVSGVGTARQRWPLVLSAAFTQTLSPERWRALRWRFFRLHFQYLCAFDRPGVYDYFRVTAGPVLLRDRFAGRQPSRSRIIAPLSPHRDVA